MKLEICNILRNQIQYSSLSLLGKTPSVLFCLVPGDLEINWRNGTQFLLVFCVWELTEKYYKTQVVRVGGLYTILTTERFGLCGIGNCGEVFRKYVGVSNDR